MLIKRIVNFNFCKSAKVEFPMLTRDFVYDRLYHSQDGYFTRKLKQQINFSELLGYEEYMRQLQDNYPENAWLTPSEIFRPYYGITIGNYIYQQFHFMKTLNQNVKRLRILEAGAGFGAASEGILTFFQQFNPVQLKDLEYHIVEISSPSCEQCEKRLIEAGFGSLLKKGIIRIIQNDILGYTPPQNTQDMWFLLFLEVFDNLPQDRIYGDRGEQIKETWVTRDPQNALVEEQRLLQDPLIKETLDYYYDFLDSKMIEPEKKDMYMFGMLRSMIEKYYGKEKQSNTFLPTYSLKVLKHIAKSFPDTRSLIVADFDMLKNQYSREGIGTPIVSQKQRKAHEKIDFKDYLIERGQADIFFPVNFDFMRFLHKKVLKQQAQVLKTYQFVDMFAKTKWTTTKSGYNPLKEDFANTSILLTDHQQIQQKSI